MKRKCTHIGTHCRYSRSHAAIADGDCVTDCPRLEEVEAAKTPTPSGQSESAGYTDAQAKTMNGCLDKINSAIYESAEFWTVGGGASRATVKKILEQLEIWGESV